MEPSAPKSPPAVDRDGAPRLAPADLGRVKNRFARRPTRIGDLVPVKGTTWFGFRSLWGHLRHFAASAIATESVDSRDWMEPDSPPDLLARVVDALEGRPDADTLASALGRDVWVDYVCDTGDDAAVAVALGRALFSEYRLPDPATPGAELTAPRGDLLVFGGDTAYPVATSHEINDRVVVPFNTVLKDIPSDQPRVVLGIPGNHDWYDGLDGFGRLFRRRRFGDVDSLPPLAPIQQGAVSRAAEFVESFIAGEQLKKPKALVISGYRPVQNASYFALPLAPGLTVWGVDRQLKTIDYRQRTFFHQQRRESPADRLWVMLPDPVFAFGSPSRRGLAMVRGLRLDLRHHTHLVTSGDVHHYRRERLGGSLHVTAGGGGAFLHPTPLVRDPERTNPAEVEWPCPAATKKILRRAPWQIGAGKAGFIVHAVMLLLFAPLLGFGTWALGHEGLGPASVSIALAAWVAYALIGGIRRGRPGPIAAIAAVAAGLTGFIPTASVRSLQWLLEHFWITAPAWLCNVAALIAAVGFGGLIFGGYLAVLTRLGLEQTQAFTAIAHPGYKHFMRLRVRADGSGIDAWCIGVEDPFDENEGPVLVDAFSWRPK